MTRHVNISCTSSRSRGPLGPCPLPTPENVIFPAHAAAKFFSSISIFEVEVCPPPPKVLDPADLNSSEMHETL